MAYGTQVLGPAWTCGVIERPLGQQNMGSWTAAVYTIEQQARLGVDAHGNTVSSETITHDAMSDNTSGDFQAKNQDKSRLACLVGYLALTATCCWGLAHMFSRVNSVNMHLRSPPVPLHRPMQMMVSQDVLVTSNGLSHQRIARQGSLGSALSATSGPQAIGPAWTRGEIEPPLGRRDMGSWTAAVYTIEQQERLGVDEYGNAQATSPQESGAQASKSILAVATALVAAGAGLLANAWGRTAPRGATSNTALNAATSDGPSSTQAVLPNVPKRVAIVGAGPGGLAFARALCQLPASHRPTQIDIYDRRDDPFKAGLGGGIQLNGGAQVLDRLGLGAELRQSGQDCTSIRSRTIKNDTLLVVDIPEIVKNFGFLSKDLLREDGNDDAIFNFTILRDELQRILVSSLPEDVVKIHPGTELSDLQDAAEGIRCCFANGTDSEPYDLVVGADGVNSAVRRLCTEGAEESASSGIRIQFGVTEGEGRPYRPPGAEGELHQWFADGLYVLTGSYGAGPDGERQEMVAAVFESGVTGPENADWQQSDVRTDCVRRMQEGTVPAAVQELAQNCDRWFEVGVRYCNPLQPWHVGGPCPEGEEQKKRPFQRGNVVLLGDAAHAMPPFLGQGANQAVQDAYCLAQELGCIDTGIVKGTMQSALAFYELKRKPTTTILLLESRFLGWLETGSGLRAMFRDLVFRVLGKTGVASAVYLNGAVPRV
uniref:FAD-binding domain-containing protein n=1 Tax=Eutreptiella gymnastica TaxID=73025 RepID=A0A7S1J4I9_9EUGL|mmetsp:Transcript_65322/g.116191  ORF Transcript_65322/g.116191 Transcript_65322/m.116191 type:complete len:712 (+) Transcript_65322:42-2177(+)